MLIGHDLFLPTEIDDHSSANAAPENLIDLWAQLFQRAFRHKVTGEIELPVLGEFLPSEQAFAYRNINGIDPQQTHASSALKFCGKTIKIKLPSNCQCKRIHNAIPMCQTPPTRGEKFVIGMFTTSDGLDQSNRPLPAAPPWASRDSPQLVLGRFGQRRTLGVHSDRR